MDGGFARGGALQKDLDGGIEIDVGLDDLAKSTDPAMAVSAAARKGMLVTSGTVTYKTPKETTMFTGDHPDAISPGPDPG